MKQRTKLPRSLFIVIMLSTTLFCINIFFGVFLMVFSGSYSIINPAIDEAAALEQNDLESTEVPEKPEISTNTEAVPTFTLLEMTPTISEQQTRTPEPYFTAELPSLSPEEATAQAALIAADVKLLFEQNAISTIDGKLHFLESYEQDWADTTTYPKTYTGFTVSGFILKADLTWQSSDLTTAADSGCGIIFYENDEEDHYLLVFTLDDRAILYRRSEGKLINLGPSYRYEVESEIAEAQILLASENSQMLVFVNQQVIYRKTLTRAEAGKLAFTVISGTSVAYGTRCEMRNIQLWEIDQ